MTLAVLLMIVVMHFPAFMVPALVCWHLQNLPRP